MLQSELQSMSRGEGSPSSLGSDDPGDDGESGEDELSLEEGEGLPTGVVPKIRGAADLLFLQTIAHTLSSYACGLTTALSSSSATHRGVRCRKGREGGARGRARERGGGFQTRQAPRRADADALHLPPGA